MAKYKPQHSRLLFIDQELGRGCYPNCSQLADGYEVSAKTIQRDIDYMRYQLDAPIEYSAKHRGYHYSEPSYKLPAISVRESDLFAIYLAEKILTQYEGTPVYDSLRSVFRKIEDSLPDKTTVNPGKGHSRFTVFSPSHTEIAPEIWGKVAEAIRLSRRLKVVYRTPGSGPGQRELDPYHGVRYEGDWYVIGHCHLRQEIRTFSLARIESVEILPDVFLVPENFDFSKFTGSHFGVHWSDKEYRVEIHFNQKVAGYIKERRWHPAQRINEHPDGSLTLSLTVNHLLELKRWVLSWGEMAQVLAPEDFIKDVQASAVAMAALYSKDQGGR
jgi:predicted DNA-binding transcriptional regulator YafY